MSLITLIGLSLLGWVLIWLFGSPSVSELFRRAPLHWQAIYGIGYGLAAALIAISVTESKALADSTRFFKTIIQNSNIRYADALFASISAGIGEELLFRGAIQPLLGIWITAVIFVAIHGYLSLKDKGMFMYGVLMVFMTAGLGYFTERLGIGAAMIAHAMFDAVIFWHLLRRR